MKLEVIKVLPASEIENTIQPLLDQGYKVKKMISQVVSSSPGFNPGYGKIIIVLEK